MNFINYKNPYWNPFYTLRGDSGFDLEAVHGITIHPGETKLVKTGFRAEIPDGYEIQIRPRSGISLKTNLDIIFGTVDSNYRGEAGIIIRNNHGHPLQLLVNLLLVLLSFGWWHILRLPYWGTYTVKKGDRLAQGVICRVETPEFRRSADLGVTNRGEKGFGSTGVNHCEL
jgi:dUTP pyrophosphatase